MTAARGVFLSANQGLTTPFCKVLILSLILSSTSCIPTDCEPDSLKCLLLLRLLSLEYISCLLSLFELRLVLSCLQDTKWMNHLTPFLQMFFSILPSIPTPTAGVVTDCICMKQYSNYVITPSVSDYFLFSEHD